jgi:hypothetical protein
MGYVLRNFDLAWNNRVEFLGSHGCSGVSLAWLFLELTRLVEVG